MAKKKTLPKPKRRKMTNNVVAGPTEMTPRLLAYYRGVDRFCHALVWIEKTKATPDNPARQVAMHVLMTDEVQGVVHDRRPPSELAYVEPTEVITTVKEFEDYLRRRLVERGGSKDAYHFLGVERPVVEVEVKTERTEDHEAMYKRASQLLGTPVDELKAKYGHLNPGLQMMNLRNRLRAKGHDPRI